MVWLYFMLHWIHNTQQSNVWGCRRRSAPTVRVVHQLLWSEKGKKQTTFSQRDPTVTKHVRCVSNGDDGYGCQGYSQEEEIHADTVHAEIHRSDDHFGGDKERKKRAQMKREKDVERVARDSWQKKRHTRTLSVFSHTHTHRHTSLTITFTRSAIFFGHLRKAVQQRVGGEV